MKFQTFIPFANLSFLTYRNVTYKISKYNIIYPHYPPSTFKTLIIIQSWS